MHFRSLILKEQLKYYLSQNVFPHSSDTCNDGYMVMTTTSHKNINCYINSAVYNGISQGKLKNEKPTKY